MNLLEIIITELSDIKIPLESALLKLNVLAYRLNNEDLKNWVTKEIDGYNISDSVPLYRKIRTILKVDYTINSYHGVAKYTCQDVPLEFSNDEIMKKFNEHEFYEGVNHIQNIINTAEKPTQILSLPYEFVNFLQLFYNNYYHPSPNVFSLYQLLSVSQLHQILSSIRKNFLELVLDLEKKYGLETPLEKFKDNSKIISKVMNKYNIKTNGDGNFINTGNKNVISFDSDIKKNDKDFLIQSLKNLKIPSQEIDELMGIIDEDKPDIRKRVLGPKVRNWFNNLNEKILNGSYDLSINISANIISSLILKYYGVS